MLLAPLQTYGHTLPLDLILVLRGFFLSLSTNFDCVLPLSCSVPCLSEVCHLNSNFGVSLLLGSTSKSTDSFSISGVIYWFEGYAPDFDLEFDPIDWADLQCYCDELARQASFNPVHSGVGDH